MKSAVQRCRTGVRHVASRGKYEPMCPAELPNGRPTMTIGAESAPPLSRIYANGDPLCGQQIEERGPASKTPKARATPI